MTDVLKSKIEEIKRYPNMVILYDASGKRLFTDYIPGQVDEKTCDGLLKGIFRMVEVKTGKKPHCGVVVRREVVGGVTFQT
jgi:hypothetical protein